MPRKIRKARSRASWRRIHKTYGLSQEQWEDLYKKQGEACWICKRKIKQLTKKYLCVDHNHKTGEIRGLLCDGCNGILQRFRDKPELFRAAASYLEQGTGLFVPSEANGYILQDGNSGSDKSPLSPRKERKTSRTLGVHN